MFGSECRQLLNATTTTVRKHLATAHPSALREVKKRELEDFNEAEPVEKKPKPLDGNPRIDVTLNKIKDKAVKYAQDSQKYDFFSPIKSPKMNVGRKKSTQLLPRYFRFRVPL